MKNKFKYTLLVIFAFVTSIIIYEYIEVNKPVVSLDNILTVQENLEKNIFDNTKNYTLENPKIILNPYGNSPLTALVIFETKDLTTPVVTIKGKDGAKDITNTFTPSKIHILPIYGLYAGYNNTITVKASGISKTINIKTDNLPSDFIKITDINKNLNTDEFYFTTPEDKGYTAAYDENGDVRWYLIGDYKWEVQRLNNGHLLISNDKLVNSPYYTKGLMEIDLLGKIYYQYDIPSGYHHSAIEMSNGNFLVASNNFKDGSVEDYIVEIDRNSGDVVKEWNLHKLQNNNKENWLGLSSLLYNKNNSITFTGKNNDMISNIDYKSGEINWIIADKKNVPKKYYKYILNGDLTLNNPTSLNALSNGDIAFINTKDDNIYLTICHIDIDNKSYSVVSETKLGKNVDASIKVDDENNYILTGDNYIKEVNNDDTLTITTDSSKLYNTEKMSLYANDIYTSGAGVKLGKIGITPTSKNVSTLFHKNGKNIIKKYNLKFVKESDRLVFTGTFNSNDDVKLILDNFLTKRTYDIVISNTPYSHNKDKGKITVSKYINNEDIYGKFYIYIRINGVNYKLEKYVIF